MQFITGTSRSPLQQRIPYAFVLGTGTAQSLQTQRQEDRCSAGLTRSRTVCSVCSACSVISLTRFTRAWQHCREVSEFSKPTARDTTRRPEDPSLGPLGPWPPSSPTHRRSEHRWSQDLVLPPTRQTGDWTAAILPWTGSACSPTAPPKTQDPGP